jgi:hypothetical protein
MTRSRRLTRFVVVTLGVLAGGLMFVAAPGLAATPETPVTKAPTVVTGNTATFNGELNPGASSETVYYRFAYTPGPRCANTNDEGRFNIPESPAEASGNHTAVSATAENLIGSTEYTVCVVAGSSEFGFFFGEELASGSPVTFSTPPAKPLVQHEHASVTPFEARLEGAVNANNQATTCKIEYGKTTGYGSEVPCEPENLEGGEQGIGATVTGLEPATTYDYRIVATNATGETEGAGEFTTLILEPPIVESESASELTPTDATLRATVNPHYQATSYSFEYSTEATGEVLEGSITTVAGASTLPPGGTGLTVAVRAGNHLTPNTVYHYRVVAKNATGAAEGTVQEFTTLLPPPAVSTGETVSVAQTSAQVTGTVNPEGLASTYEYQYGTSTSYEQSSATLEAGEGTDAVPVPGSLTDLAPSTVYHYRLVATNDDGTSYGEDETLTTLPGTPPTATTGGASVVSQNAATLAGTVSTNGLQTSYGFEIGTEADNYGPATGLGSLGGVTTQTVSFSLGELQPATTYHYRVFAGNGEGTSYGADQTFTMPGFPTLVTVPSAPPLIATPAIVFPTETGTTTTTTTKAPTRAQKLAAALKACRKKSKNLRAGCEKRARKQYAPAKGGATKKHNKQH